MTRRQKELFTEPSNQAVVLTGSCGTGKTFLLREKAMARMIGDQSSTEAKNNQVLFVVGSLTSENIESVLLLEKMTNEFSLTPRYIRVARANHLGTFLNFSKHVYKWPLFLTTYN